MYGNMYNQNNNQQMNMNPMMNMNMNSMGMGFAQNNGVTFNNVAPAKTSSSTPEEMAIIKANKRQEFTVTPEEMAIFQWDLRDGQALAVEIVDPGAERVRTKYTNTEFNIVMQPKEVLEAYLDGIKNFVYTTALMDTIDNPEVLKQVLGAFGVVNKLLPIAYENGKKGYDRTYAQMQQMCNASGYQGTFGGNNVWNGTIGSVPQFIVNDSGMVNQAAMQQQQMLQQAVQMGMQQGQQQMLQQMQNGMMNNMNMMNNNMGMGMMNNMNNGMNNVPMVSGGTMMGGNAFTVGGVPQMTTPQQNQQTPQMNNTVPQIPQPGTLNVNSAATQSVQGTANPSIGGTATTAKVTI